MKSTGVVRRIDDLGRIVIPKEIRRTLKIRDGEELEIYVDDDVIVLKKFSKVADLADVAKKIIDVISSLIGKTVLVADRDRYIVGSGTNNKFFINKSVSKYINDVIFSQKMVVEKNISHVNLINNLVESYSYIVHPIICYGDSVGAVVFLSNSSDISEFDVNISSMIAQFLGKYVED